MPLTSVQYDVSCSALDRQALERVCVLCDRYLAGTIFLYHALQMEHQGCVTLYIRSVTLSSVTLCVV